MCSNCDVKQCDSKLVNAFVGPYTIKYHTYVDINGRTYNSYRSISEYHKHVQFPRIAFQMFYKKQLYK